MPVVYINKRRAAKLAKSIVGENAPTKWQGLDDVFIHKSQINIGTEFVNYGRLEHGTVWRVTEIKTYSAGGRTTKVDNVQKTSDNVVLLKRGSNETRQMSFIYLSYSAIWRLFK